MTARHTHQLTRWQRDRRAFIEHRIFWHGSIGLADLMDVMEISRAPEDQVAIHLVTGPHDGEIQKQRELLESITEACTGSGVDFTWAFDTSGKVHARDIVTDTGWKIVLDRGLDIFQAPLRREGFNLGDRLQEHRMLKGFYVTYVRQ